MEQLYKDRLLLLATNLDIAKNFNFRRWVGGDWQGLPDLSCGTTACGMGLATTIPEFRALGLYMYAVGGRQNDGTYFGIPCIEGDEGNSDCAENAASVIFGLDRESFNYLFIPSGDRGDYDDPDNVELKERFGDIGLHGDATAQQLAAHIRHFVEMS